MIPLKKEDAGEWIYTLPGMEPVAATVFWDERGFTAVRVDDVSQLPVHMIDEAVWEQVEMMKCEWCGKEFPADPRACVDAGIDAYHPPEDGEEWKGEEPTELPPGHFAAADREHMKKEMGLDDAQLDQLLATGKIDGLGAIICLECQDAGLEAAEAE